jgi:hypothetical protein
MSAGTLNITERYVSQPCIKCGVMFALTEAYDRELRKNHHYFYCPNGHQQYYSGKNDAEQAQARADESARAAERLRQQLKRREEDLQSERRRHSATKGQLTKTKRRIAHGVCPCCTRSFANVERHMANKHPDYVSEAKA